MVKFSLSIGLRGIQRTLIRVCTRRELTRLNYIKFKWLCRNAQERSPVDLFQLHCSRYLNTVTKILLTDFVETSMISSSLFFFFFFSLLILSEHSYEYVSQYLIHRVKRVEHVRFYCFETDCVVIICYFRSLSESIDCSRKGP